jgi:uncharacterized membrane protein YbjE (DUF340 family)
MKQYSTPIKSRSIILLKAVIILTAVCALALMIRFPQIEGRATNLDLLSIYKDPFIIYLYIASVPFFVALYQAFKLLSCINKNKIFSQVFGNAVRNIRYCAIIIIGFIIGAEAYLFLVERSKSDDIAGGVAMGIFLTVIFVVIASVAFVFETHSRIKHTNLKV